MSADERKMRLAVYGTLAPGKPNAHVLGRLGGRWRTGTVRGRLVQEGWGTGLGYPGLVLDDSADPVEVELLESPGLPGYWQTLDAFEGGGYTRMPVNVTIADEVIAAFIYAIAPPA